MKKVYFWVLVIIIIILIIMAVLMFLLGPNYLLAVSQLIFEKTGVFQDKNSGLYIYLGNYKDGDGKVIQSNIIISDDSTMDEQKLNQTVQQWGCEM